MVTARSRAAPLRWDVERRRLVRALRRHADRSAGRFLRSYLGSPLPVLGVRALRFQVVARSARTRFRSLPEDAVLSELRALWDGPWFEERALAIECLGDFARRDEVMAWKLADQWVDSATGWGLSDALASGPVAQMVAAKPNRFSELLTWTSSANFWRRRAATYALKEWVHRGKLGRPFRLLRRLLKDPEFWVQRAVGTWLRECWKRDRRTTERFLRRHAKVLSRTTITVATERASKAFREELRRRNRRTAKLAPRRA
jgi:3-methyladenine DNA glycosylase AlkD